MSGLGSIHRFWAAPALLMAVTACTEPLAEKDSRPPAVIDAGADDLARGTEDAKLPPPPRVFGGDRPVELKVPRVYDGRPIPLVLILHGWSYDGELAKTHWLLSDLHERAGVLTVAPDGTQNEVGVRFWHASDTCCDFYRSGVDDVAYLLGLVADIRRAYNVDPRRVYLFGHANGGFMSYRLACERPSDFAAVVSVGGATLSDKSACAPTEPVSVLQIHGTLDNVVLFGGGVLPTNGQPYPGARATTRYWSEYNGCHSQMRELAKIDLYLDVLGAETRMLASEGCPSGIDVHLWQVDGGPHLFVPHATFPDQLWNWLRAHPKPPAK